jgi:hypothetical protein
MSIRLQNRDQGNRKYFADLGEPEQEAPAHDDLKNFANRDEMRSYKKCKENPGTLQ